MRTTIDDIAVLAGVSAGTVSRVLNGKNKENRPAILRRAENIRKMAARLGYRPNAAARSVVRGHFGLTAFVTCGDLGLDWYPASAIHGIHAELERRGSRLMFNEIPAEKLRDPAYIPPLFRETSVDGIIGNIHPVFQETMIPYFESQPVPCVWINMKRPLRSVYPDEADGIRKVLEFLLAKGHRKIGYFKAAAMPGLKHFSIGARAGGVSNALAAKGLDPSMVYVPEGEFGPELRVPWGGEFLKRFPMVTAVVCYGQGDALRLYSAALRKGIRVPEDLQIVCFGERAVQEITDIAMPTIIVPFRRIGEECVRMLTRVIESGNRDEPSVVVPYERVSDI